MVPPVSQLTFLKVVQEFNRKKQELIASGTVMLQSASDSMPDLIFNRLAQGSGILSLTEDPTNPPMWAHYADNQSGFVLQFDDAHEWFRQRRSDSDDFRHLRKVSYVSAPESRYIMDLDAADILYSKSAEWQYEREWRIIRSLEEASVIDGDVYLFEFPPQILTGIIFGLRSDFSLKSSAKALITEQSALRHMKIGEVTRSSEGTTLAVNWHCA
jgi:hypothetical protein